MRGVWGFFSALGALVLAVSAASAVSSRSWDISTAEQFSLGTLDGTAIDADGRVRLSLARQTLWGPAAGIVWDIEPAGRDSAFVALSTPGRVLRVVRDGEPERWYETAEESMVAALVPDGEGGVFFGLSPEGRLLRASGPGNTQTAAETGALFIWALARSEDGTIWIGTGLPGMLLRYRPGGEPRAVFESGDDPVRCITALPGGGVLIGTGGRGRVIRIDASGRPFVLFDAEEAEIVALERDPQGHVFALAASGSKQVAAARTAAAGALETVRVVATPPAERPSDDDNEKPKTPKQPPKPPSTGFKTPPGGALYRLDATGGSRRIWTTKRDVPFALARAEDGMLLVATGDLGRIYRMDDRGRSSMVLEIPSDQASAMARAPGGWILVGGTTDARVERLGPGLRHSGSYLSPAHDAGTVAEWGRLTWDADVPRGADLRVAVRAGNTAEPDETWSDWMLPNGRGAEGLPATRWFQARLDMRPSGKGSSPLLRRLELHYLPRNRSPEIEELVVQPAGVVWTRSPSQTSRPRGPVVADDPVVRDVVKGLSPKAPVRPIRKMFELGARTVTWKAEDPDADHLTYSLEIRREGRSAWLPLATDLDQSFHGWDTRGMPDGMYRVQLTVDDSQDNPEGKEHRDRRVSAAFRVDNTRPSVGQPDIRREDGRYEVEFVVSDPGGAVVAVEVAVDGGAWQPLDPTDGVADSAQERYRMGIEPDAGAPAGGRSLRVRAADSSGNLAGDAWVLDED